MLNRLPGPARRGLQESDSAALALTSLTSRVPGRYAGSVVALAGGAANVLYLLDALSVAERADVLAGTNAIDITSKVQTLIATAAATPGTIVDMTVLRGTVTLTGSPFGSLKTAEITLLIGRVTLKTDFTVTDSSYRIPSKCRWVWDGTRVAPAVAITGDAAGTNAQDKGLITTAYVETTGNATSANATISVTSAADFHVGARVAILGAEAEANITSLTLDGGINSSASSLTIDGAGGAILSHGNNIYIKIDSEIIRGNLVGTTFSVSTRGALGTTAASHLDNAPITWMKSHLATITGISGTNVTLDTATSQTVTGARVICGALDPIIEGWGEIDGEWTYAGAPSAFFIGLSSTLSTGFKVSKDIISRRHPHGGLFLYGCDKANIELAEIADCGKPADLLGADLWLFGGVTNSKVAVRRARNGYITAMVDNKSNGVADIGAERPCSRNIVEVGSIAGGVHPIYIAGCNDNVVRVTYASTSDGVICRTTDSQTDTDPGSSGNVLIVEKYATFRQAAGVGLDINRLEDYRKTAVDIVPTASSGTFTDANFAGMVEKRGSLVTMHGVLTITTVGTASGTTFIATPYKPKDHFGTTCRLSGAPTVVGVILGSATNERLEILTSAGGGIMAAAAQAYIMVSYLTDE